MSVCLCLKLCIINVEFFLCCTFNLRSHHLFHFVLFFLELSIFCTFHTLNLPIKRPTAHYTISFYLIVESVNLKSVCFQTDLRQRVAYPDSRQIKFLTFISTRFFWKVTSCCFGSETTCTADVVMKVREHNHPWMAELHKYLRTPLTLVGAYFKSLKTSCLSICINVHSRNRLTADKQKQTSTGFLLSALCGTANQNQGNEWRYWLVCKHVGHQYILVFQLRKLHFLSII